MFTKTFPAVLWCFVPILATAQLRDNFTDRDFTTNPAWSGNTSSFTIDNERLRLSASPGATVAFLSTPSAAVENASWEFVLMMDFNPSSTNYAKIYLTSDNADLTGPLNGYFIMAGGTNDEVSLYRQSGNATTKIIDGTDGTLNLSSVHVHVRATRNDNGDWELFTNSSGAWVSEGRTTDLTHQHSNFFGVVCVFTSTRTDKFYFDDFIATGSVVTDKLPPEVTVVNALSPTQITISVNEPLRAPLKTESFRINNLSPAMLSLNGEGNVITLTLPFSMVNGKKYRLEIIELVDPADNITRNLTFPVHYFVPMPVNYRDVIIHEIFPDPEPRVGLPGVEFVEIKNRSTNPVDLQNWILTDGSSKGKLSPFILLPDSIAVLTTRPSASLFSPGIIVIPTENFPTLNNTSDLLVLSNAEGKTIDSLRYDLSWYRDEDKAQGGYSLELIDSENICAEETNWEASEDPSGGTPGAANSVQANKPDLTPPIITNIVLRNADTLEISFNERMQSAIPPLSSITITPDAELKALSWKAGKRTLIATGVFGLHKLYVVTIKQIADCAGNLLDDYTDTLAIAQEAMRGDVVVNEILFNPKPGGVDFFELINQSEKFIDLVNWSVSRVDEIEKDKKIIGIRSIILRPREIRAFTPDAKVLASHYSKAKGSRFIETEIAPMNDDEGVLILRDGRAVLMDSVPYKDDMHSMFIQNPEGVSLERVAPDAASANPDNWHSASSLENFATPGYRNSNARQVSETPEPVRVDPEVFRPVTGSPAFTLLHFNFDRGGQLANITIYDASGRSVKRLANNAQLGTTGFIRWEGDDDDGKMVRTGNYLILVELSDPSGKMMTYKRRVVVY